MQRSFFSSLSGRSIFVLTFFNLSVLTLAGCGAGTDAVGNPQANLPGSGRAIIGKSHGGVNPVMNQNIILWSTLSNNAGMAGYPSSSNTATTNACPLLSAGSNCSSSTYTSAELASTMTGTDGSFSFTAGSYTCPSGQFAYITGTGGNTGANTANNQEVMIAALGPCSHFDNATDEGNIIISLSEVTTVAAAYALGNFMYVNDNTGNGHQLVFISAPPNNNAATGSCSSGQPKSSMTCTAAGLAHAFANAANLVNAVSYTGTPPTGAAYTNPPSNPIFGTVPAALINTLGNILQYCTNSTGGTGGSTPCGTLFTDATPNSSTNNVTTTPVNTLQAIMAIAKSPQHNVPTIYGLASPNSFFQPALSAYPHDWTIAITYAPVSYDSANTSKSAISITGYTSTTSAVTFTASNSLVNGQQVYVTGFPSSTFLNGLTYVVSSASSTSFVGTPAISTTLTANSNVTEGASAYIDNPLHVSLDANDNVYVTGSDGATPTEGGMSALSANGTPVWTNKLSTSYCQPVMSATDTNGNVWMSSNQSSMGCGSSAVYLEGFVTSTGAASSAPVTAAQISQTSALAVDRSNNIWTGRLSANCGVTTVCIYEFPCTYSTFCTYGKTSESNVTGSTVAGLDQVGYMTIDANQNIWFSSNPGAGTSTDDYISVFQNTGTLSSPAWTNSINNFSSTALEYGGYGSVALDGAGNVWGGATNGSSTYVLGEIPITYGGTNGKAATMGSLTNITPASSASHPSQGVFDGIGTYWYPSTTSSGQIFYYAPSTASAKNIIPCYIPVPGTTTASCSTSFSTYYPRNLVIDSTGSMWVTSELGGEVVQIVGSASPTWPQLSYAVFGTLPQ